MIPVFSHSFAKRLPFFYGYVMIPVAMLLQIATSPGQTFAVSAFTPYLRESLELSDSQLSLAYMIGTLLAALPLMLVGPLSDRYGLRGISLIAIGMLSAACYFAAKVTNFYSLLAAFFFTSFSGSRISLSSQWQCNFDVVSESHWTSLCCHEYWYSDCFCMDS